jgi:hypothetical protein
VGKHTSNVPNIEISRATWRTRKYPLDKTATRQNMIIVNLVDIANKLDDIKQDQFCMYKELSIVNKSLSTIESTLSEMKSSLDNTTAISRANLALQTEIGKRMKIVSVISVADFLGM